MGLEFSFLYSSFLPASGMTLYCRGSPHIHRSDRAAMGEALRTCRAGHHVLCP